ncbi:LLM class flavin-dependent oxidoreductase [Microbacterium horticulturae]|uniref:LLM class flavin-dependent oxidoreductase n=1 Tax=Microbacterium horticulturae TaxID=3028316 RepID=A0ABY8C456_9MICO|nr:LLM class flavin-dependent oxidoreductase [Microbacterium sp. KACC 23027]WEG09975.1 LLM class flavin-dependent oxidoreductase [Microbacterium sp. KACC 23027]
MSIAPVSIGVAGVLGPAAIARIAAAAEQAGLYALWVNDTPGGDALAALHEAARATETLVLGTGVVPLDRRTPDEILIDAAGLPEDRLILGIGSGQASGPVLAAVRNAVDALRERTAAGIAVGALGPKMRALAAEVADGMLLNWLPAREAAAQTVEAHEGAPGVNVALYVRTALDDGGMPRLRAEGERYARFPKYAANFARLGVAPDDTVLTPGAEGLAAYRVAVDEVVLRAMTASDETDDYVRFVERAGALAVE